MTDTPSTRMAARMRARCAWLVYGDIEIRGRGTPTIIPHLFRDARTGQGKAAPGIGGSGLGKDQFWSIESTRRKTCVSLSVSSIWARGLLDFATSVKAL